jgi:hypothetical protein
MIKMSEVFSSLSQPSKLWDSEKRRNHFSSKLNLTKNPESQAGLPDGTFSKPKSLFE